MTDTFNVYCDESCQKNDERVAARGALRKRSGALRQRDRFGSGLEPVEIVRPMLHHLAPLGQVGVRSKVLPLRGRKRK